MSIKIHHGPPGSYKTSGAVMDDFVPAVVKGRVVVTNVRGLDDRDHIEGVLEKYGFEVEDGFELIHVESKTKEGIIKWGKWFHWVPHGALLLVDEAQEVWPKRWTANDLRMIDYPGGPDKALADNRPANWEQALDMHRHYGWDIIATCPQIKKLRDDFRTIAEVAYKHKNHAVIGIKGRYLEGAHLADDGGTADSHFLSLKTKRIKPYVWELYRSTATGTHSDTIAGFNIFASPRVVLLASVLAGAAYFAFSAGVPDIFKSPENRQHTPKPVAPAPAPGAGSSPVAIAGTAAPAPVHSGTVGAVAVPAVYPAASSVNYRQTSNVNITRSAGLPHPLTDHQLSLIGVIGWAGKSPRVLVSAQYGQNQPFTLTQQDLTDMGYYVRPSPSSCLAYLVWHTDMPIVLTCQGAARSAPSAPDQAPPPEQQPPRQQPRYQAAPKVVPLEYAPQPSVLVAR